jgi:hyperosmotically inducible protein
MKTPHRSFFALTALFAAMSISLVACNKAQEPVAPAAARTTIGTQIDDTVVTASVKSALLADADIKSFDFRVETRKGEVMLSGFVDNQAQLDRANALTQAVAGVKTIQNNVSLKGAATTVGNKVDDGIVTTKVKAALMGDENVKSNDITVVTRKGEVQLSGFVNSQNQIERALLVAKAVEGVSSVSNEMSIKK